MELRERLAFNLQRLRRERGLSQEALALRARTTRGYMHKIEACKSAATVDRIELIAKALEVDPLELFRPRD